MASGAVSAGILLFSLLAVQPQTFRTGAPELGPLLIMLVLAWMTLTAAFAVIGERL